MRSNVGKALRRTKQTWRDEDVHGGADGEDSTQIRIVQPHIILSTPIPPVFWK